MKIAIYGAGAIGSYLGVRLHQAGAEVSLIARGAQLAAMKANGVTLKTEDGTVTVRPLVTGDAGEAGRQDFVFIALKGQDLPKAASDIARLMGPHTTLVTAMNGIPYWYLHGIDSPLAGRTLQSVDPKGTIARVLPPDRVIGSVLYPWAEVIAPGVVEQSTSNRFVMGEPDGSESARIRRLTGIMNAGGLDAPITRDIRTEIWLKLWGNLCFNPLSVLTGATIDRLTSVPELLALERAMMLEAEAVANALGITFPYDVEKRIEITAMAGARKTSTLQDFERGKPLEIEPLLGAVVELGELAGVAMPLCRTVLALVRERGRTRVGRRV
jgi:2-dehydropantoate 2-reductase